MKRSFLAFLTLIMLALTTSAQAASSSAFSGYSNDFVKKIALASQFEVLSGHVALLRSNNPKVKAFGQEMITDHTKTLEDMQTAIIEAKKDMRISAPPKTLDDDHQEIIESLKSASADDFDAAYIDTQLKLHQDLLERFGEYKENGDNAALKSFAASAIPTLEIHKQHIDKLAAEKSKK